MAWTIIGGSNVVEDANGDFTLTAPGGTPTIGDLLVACIAMRSTFAVTPPAGEGWQLVATQQNSGDTVATGAGIAAGVMYYKILTSAADGSLAFTRASGTAILQGTILRYRCTSTNPVYRTGNATTRGTAGQPGAATLSLTAGDLIIYMVSSGDDNTCGAFDAATDPATASGSDAVQAAARNTGTNPTTGTWVLRFNQTTTTGADSGIAVADAVKTDTAATGAMSAASDGADRPVSIVGAFYEGAADYPKTPAAGSVVAAGVLGTLAFGLIAGAGSLAVTGYAPTVQVKTDYQITPAVGGVSLAGYQPGQETRITPSGGSFAVTGYGPTVNSGRSITPPAGLVKLGLFSVGSAEITPDAGSVSIAGSAPTLAKTLSIPSGDLTLAGYAPTVTQGIGISPAVGSVAATGYAPQANKGITPSSGALSAAGYAPTVQKDVRISPAVGTLSAAGNVPQANKGITPSGGSLGLTGYAPQANKGISPSAGALSAAGYAPTVTQGISISPAAGSASLAGATPGIGRGVVSPVGALSVGGYAPTVRQDRFITPPAVGVVAAGYIPTRDAGITPSVRSVSITGAQPEQAKTLAVPSGVVIVEGQYPQLGGALVIQPLAGSLSSQGSVPRVNRTLSVPSASLSVSGYAPEQDLGITPAVIPVTITGYAPQVVVPSGVSKEITPGTGRLTLAGYAPSLGGGAFIPIFRRRKR